MAEPHLPPIIFLFGPRAVGKSTIGYHLFTRLNRTVAKSAYVDLAQLAFCHPAPADDPHHHRLKATTLAAMWLNFRSVGARHLVVIGVTVTPEHLAPYRESLHPTRFTLVRLDATPEALSSRLADRALGYGPTIPGDTLRGRSPSELRDVTELTLREAAALQAPDMAGLPDLAFDTSDLTAPDSADALFRLLSAEPD